MLLSSVRICCIACKADKPLDPTLQSVLGWKHASGLYLCPRCIGPSLVVGHPIKAIEIKFLYALLALYGEDGVKYTKQDLATLVPDTALTEAQVLAIGKKSEEGLGDVPLTPRGYAMLEELMRLAEKQDPAYQGAGYPCPVCHRGAGAPCVGSEIGDSRFLRADGNATAVCSARTKVRLIEAATPWRMEQIDAKSGKALQSFMATGNGVGGSDYKHIQSSIFGLN